VALDELRAMRDQRAHQCRRKTEDGDTLGLDEPPEPVGGGPVGRSLREDDRAAERHPADDFPRAHDPAHVGDEVDHVAGPRVGLVGDLARDRDEEATLHVKHALRRAGRARGVGEQVRVLRVDLQRLERAGRLGDGLVPEEVAACLHRYLAAETPPDDDVLDRR
jgi:hypothetical protein